MSIGTPEAEVSVDEALVRELSLEQQPDLADPDLLCQARGWAVRFGALLLDTGLVDHPRHAVMGEKILRCIAEDEAPLRGDSGK